MKDRSRLFKIIKNGLLMCKHRDIETFAEQLEKELLLNYQLDEEPEPAKPLGRRAPAEKRPHAN